MMTTPTDTWPGRRTRSPPGRPTTRSTSRPLEHPTFRPPPEQRVAHRPDPHVAAHPPWYPNAALATTIMYPVDTISDVGLARGPAAWPGAVSRRRSTTSSPGSTSAPAHVVSSRYRRIGRARPGVPRPARLADVHLDRSRRGDPGAAEEGSSWVARPTSRSASPTTLHRLLHRRQRAPAPPRSHCSTCPSRTFRTFHKAAVPRRVPRRRSTGDPPDARCSTQNSRSTHADRPQQGRRPHRQRRHGSSSPTPGTCSPSSDPRSSPAQVLDFIRDVDGSSIAWTTTTSSVSCGSVARGSAARRVGGATRAGSRSSRRAPLRLRGCGRGARVTRGRRHRCTSRSRR